MKKLLLFCILFSSALFGQTKTGSTAAPFLNIGIGPKAVGMGGAFVATANDVSALYWNPGGMARADVNEAMFAHSSWFADIQFNWVGGMIKMGDVGSIGASLTYLDYGKVEVTNNNAQEGTGEMYSSSDIALALSYGYNLTDRFSFGINMKYINQRIWHSSASGFAVDIGTLFASDIYGIRIGAAISNFGTEMRMRGKDLLLQHDIDDGQSGNNAEIMAMWETDYYPLPMTFRVGLAKDFMVDDMNRITIGMDAIHPNDNAEAMNIGGEYSFNNNIMLRAGYKSLFLDNSEEGLSFGVGLRHEFSTNFIINVDYAYQDFGILDYTQHFSIGVRF